MFFSLPPAPFSSPLAATWREKASSCLAFAAALEELATVAPREIRHDFFKAVQTLRQCAKGMVKAGSGALEG